jgi:DNA-binding NarL/FixJ family response regulator
VARRGAATAVIVDHWPLIRLGVTRVLNTNDVRVVGETGLPLEGVQLARANVVDLVLLGEFDGDRIDTISRLASLDEPPKIVLFLGQAVREELVALLNAGADALLVRNVAPPELGDAVRKVLAGERVVSPPFLSALVGFLESAEPKSVAGGVLTGKETEVLRALAYGRTNQEIAGLLFVTESTVKSHLAHIYTKLSVRTRHEAVARAVELGLLS